ncbi:DUF5615 family PIN-like protein [Ignicoccus hospitalis]|uniref:DUF5615 domain-containing protein n=1 Tax=Ignicoccus hospitalis (strain KIN4/I / DSM 18386 / JCM 14125) TaxID=453591 RepID=A8ABE4_IGNH4|nr:DUF5615 family PIN-like protein [Ignicoccus hospitalis]ABU82246.1 hypothetical protein Igni_1069 [Ignicoccus hospitalis KIN4/I]HIH90186.1 DUF5615 family PIN-like protein [Desulfurococcaceae archaeon]
MSKPRLLADENIPRTAIVTLREKGYDVVSVWELSPGISDEEVVELAIKERRIIVTFDKDFGRIARLNPNLNPNTTGVILLRIPPLNPIYVAERILSVLERIENPYGKLIIVKKGAIKTITLHQ